MQTEIKYWSLFKVYLGAFLFISIFKFSRSWSHAYLTLSYLQTHFYAIAADDFWKHCGQRRNCSWWAISPLATMFQLYLTVKLSFMQMFRVFATFVFEVICCRFVVHGKGLNAKRKQKCNEKIGHINLSLKSKEVIAHKKQLWVLNKIPNIMLRFIVGVNIFLKKPIYPDYGLNLRVSHHPKTDLLLFRIEWLWRSNYTHVRSWPWFLDNVVPE